MFKMVLFIFFPLTSLATTMEQTYTDGQNIAAKNQMMVENLVQNFDPTIVPGYATNPDLNQNQEPYNTIMQSFNQRPAYNTTNTQICTKNLVVEPNQPANIEQDMTITVHGKAKTSGLFKHSITVILDVKHGLLVSSDGANVSANFSAPLNYTNCNSTQITSLTASIISGYNKGSIAIISYPTCSNNFILQIKIETAWDTNIGARLSMHYSEATPPTIKETWINTCPGLEQNASCNTSKETCSLESATKIINGFSITRNCWQKTFSYQCNSTTPNTIPTNTNANALTPDSNQIFCLDGSCSNQNYQPSKDFEQAMSTLAAAGEAEITFDNHFIYKGKAETCRTQALGYLNCCTDKGWGKDLNLAKCTSEEKALGKAQEQGLTIQVGDQYCSHRTLGICTENKKSYCIFNSKLARIVQEQGRRDQLKINFGDEENPNCQGLTPEQLQKIDFKKINFKDFYIDLKTNMSKPDLAQTQERIKEEINALYQ
jgi:hypothetical protein